jgi:hypothetical protein
MKPTNEIAPAPVHSLVGQTGSLEECWRDYILGDLDSGFEWALHPMLCNRSDYMERFIKSAKDEIDRLRLRESKCPTMREAKARALVRALQEIAACVGIDQNNSSPAEIVAAVRCLSNASDNRAGEARSGSSPCWMPAPSTGETKCN